MIKNKTLLYLVVSLFCMELRCAEVNQDDPIAEQAQEDLVVGDLFIVPNSLNPLDESSYLFETLSRALGEQIQPGELLVEVWATSDESNNWKCHEHPILDKDRSTPGPNAFPSHLPLHMLDGKKEGDQVQLTVKSIPVVLTCAQLKYRYSKTRSGQDITFEERLASLKQSYDQ